MVSLNKSPSSHSRYNFITTITHPSYDGKSNNSKDQKGVKSKNNVQFTNLQSWKFIREKSNLYDNVLITQRENHQQRLNSIDKYVNDFISKSRTSESIKQPKQKQRAIYIDHLENSSILDDSEAKGSSYFLEQITQKIKERQSDLGSLKF